MTWPEVFIVLICSHLAGDFLLQTEFQALNKFGGLSGGPALRALVLHAATYLLAFVPALVWLSGDHGLGGLIGIGGLIVVPHLLQDDGRLVRSYLRHVKHSVTQPGEVLFIAVDQSFHILVLFGVALIAGA